jgi:hypothetical protein
MTGRRDKTMRKVLAMVAGIVVVMAWAGGGGAEIGYINLLQSALPPNTSVYQPYNCAPCHLTNQGGLGGSPNLTPFGELLVQDGVTASLNLPSEQPLFDTALAEIKLDQQKVYSDLLTGHDPSPDVGAIVHTPEYGCDAGGGAKSTPPWWVAAVGALAVVAWRRRAAGACRRWVMRAPRET